MYARRDRKHRNFRLAARIGRKLFRDFNRFGNNSWIRVYWLGEERAFLCKEAQDVTSELKQDILS